MSTIVLASNNLGKLAEIQQILQGLPFHVVPQNNYAVSEVEETGLSFVENAIIKARHASTATGLPAFADDSGLEVDALFGAPGIYSARYAGLNATAQENNTRLLHSLAGVSEDQRTARFQSVIVFMRHGEDPTPLICQGTWEGRILFTPQGNGGHGYDPIFYVEKHSCSAAELTPTEKNRISHRGIALRQLLKLLPQQLRSTKNVGTLIA